MAILGVLAVDFAVEFVPIMSIPNVQKSTLSCSLVAPSSNMVGNSLLPFTPLLYTVISIVIFCGEWEEQWPRFA